jgi:hypothetical protein
MRLQASRSQPVSKFLDLLIWPVQTNGSLLSMVKSRALMVAEVLRYDQTLPRKPGSRPT